MIKPTPLFMAAIRPAAAGSAAPAVAAATLCSGSSATGAVVPAMYVFGDSLVDAGNNDFLPVPAPRAVPPNGVDLPRNISWRTGRFTNAYNLADIIGSAAACVASATVNARASVTLSAAAALQCKIRGRYNNTRSTASGIPEEPPAYLSLTTPSSRLDLLRGRVGTNYASGGSGILDATGNGTITLREQVALFAKTKATILRAGLVGQKSLDGLVGRSLFVISTGGNDFGAFDPGGLPLSQAPEFMAGMVADYLEYINALYKLGARKLVLLDALPVGCLPGQRATTADGEYCDGDQNYLSELFNSLLRVEMAKAVAASMPAMSYSIASLYNVITDMIADPTLAGLREVKTACCGSGKFNGEVDCSVDTNLCADRDEYLFWDKYHGTQAAYRRAVQAFFYGTTTEVEPINLYQLLQEHYSMATARSSSM